MALLCFAAFAFWIKHPRCGLGVASSFGPLLEVSQSSEWVFGETQRQTDTDFCLSVFPLVVSHSLGSGVPF